MTHPLSDASPRPAAPAQRRKAIFLDVDGTLIDHQGIVAYSTRAAVEQARSAGHLVFLCTGRSRAELWPELLEIGFDGLVGGAGAYVAIDGTVLAHHTFDVEHFDAIHDVLLDRDVMVYFEAHDGVYSRPEVRDHLLGILERLPDPEHAATLRRGMFHFIERMDVDADPRTKEITKAVYMGSPDPVDAVRAALGSRFDVLPTSTLLFGDDCGELAIPGVHKAAGIDVLTRHLGIAREDTVAIGDGHNDLEMLQQVQVGIAMGNSPDIVKAHADEVTGSVSEDGVWDALARHGLLG